MRFSELDRGSIFTCVDRATLNIKLVTDEGGFGNVVILTGKYSGRTTVIHPHTEVVRCVGSVAAFSFREASDEV